MIKFLFLFLTMSLSILGFTDLSNAKENPNAKFMGIAKCGSGGCHGSPKLGNQQAAWDESAHAKATSDLTSKKGNEYAKKINISNPAESDLCLSCHSTAFGVAEARLGDMFEPSDGVQCEACHSAGSEYIDLHRKKGAVYEEVVAKGMRPLKTVLQQKDLCAQCHGANEKFEKLKGSGHSNPNKMSFDEGTKKIKHWKD